MSWALRTSSITLPGAIIVGVAGAVMFGVGVLVPSHVHAETSDWLSFAGSVIGSAITVAGGITVLEWQRGRERREMVQLLQDLLTEAYDACIPFQSANPAALQQRYGRTVREQVEEVQGAVARIHAFRHRLAPTTVAMMKANDALAELAFEPTNDELTALTLYPNDADLGGLNVMGHEVQTIVRSARRLLAA